MKIKLNTRHYIVELVIENESVKITEDVAVGQQIHSSHIEQFLTIANDNISDVDFVVDIFRSYLNDSERKDFLEQISEYI